MPCHGHLPYQRPPSQATQHPHPTVRFFPTVDSDGEGSEDEEAERNLPLLSQYLQSGGKSPQQLRRQRGASTTPGAGDRSPAGLDAQQTGGGVGQSPLGEQASPAGPQASPLQSADPRMLGARSALGSRGSTFHTLLVICCSDASC